MKLLTYSPVTGVERLGVLIGDKILDMEFGHRAAADKIQFSLGYLPSNILDFLRLDNAAIHTAHALCNWFKDNHDKEDIAEFWYYAASVSLCSPVPRPTSMRDGYAFRQHVEAARRNRGLEMIPEFDDIPIFYITNHQAVFGPGEIPVQELHLNQLDFELECAIVIGKQGSNIPANKADEYIAGYMVMNDWSARALQMQEMKLNLGPAKGKDFATSLGPWLVTKDELEDRKISTPNGDKYDLEMKTIINGKEISKGNVKDMSWTFAQIIERASYGVTLYPGDVIGSGTCGTGCFLELNGSKVFNPPMWVMPDDVVDCSVELLGTLSNTVQLV
ncbi:MAG: fumarylacetoacetate hydrolase family protein [Ignavibacteriae bacterium]|nr:fumarylacetoacetate hydrolase family protein [Ignavibacteriota bacterium]